MAGSVSGGSYLVSAASDYITEWVERGLVPDGVVRMIIRRLLQQRLGEIEPSDSEGAAWRLEAFVRMMDAAPIAPAPEEANEQHYEVPASFFAEVLGEKGKYSCCYWRQHQQSLERAEADALQLTCDRAGIRDGMRVLELGCGWGALTLWIARHYPHSHVIGISNSVEQREYIESRMRREGLDNVDIVTADMNDFVIEQRFQRVVSLEMFEHMRNYRKLFERIYDWLEPDGKFFMHIFCHRLVPYEFIDRDASDWMSRYFFSGGIMPSDALPLHFQDRLKLCRQWRWDGRHYERTLNAWLARMDQRKARIMPILRHTYGDEAEIWWTRWRLFFMACAELFGFNNGQEWWVSHYLFERPA